jgi:hypothetical protein
MKRPENDKWLDEALSEVIGSEKPGTDFEQWKQKYPEAVEMLTSRTSRASREVLGEIERSQTMSVRNRSWKIAAVAALICTGVVAAAVVGVKIHKWRFVEKLPEAGYLLVDEDGLKGRTIPESWAESPERAVEVAEELDLLKQQGAGELVSVVEKEVNGKLISRVFISKYVLADGREIKSSDRDPDFKEQLTEAQDEELTNLLRADEYVTIGFEEKEFRGRMFSFERNRFILSDGTEVIWSAGKPSEDRQDTVRSVVRDPKEAEQILKEKREIEILRQQDKRQLIGVKELKANGELDLRVFVYQYKLSDGRTRDISEGGAVNNVLNKEQRQEWRQCKNKGSGEDLGTYEEQVKGRMFVFKRQRFTLSDGTELIWSYGTRKNDK